MNLLDLLGRGAQGVGSVLGDVGQGVAQGVQGLGRGVLGGGGQPGQPGQGRLNLQALADTIQDPFTKAALLQLAVPRTQDLLGAVGRVPVLGPVLGTGLDVLSTVQAARRGGLGRELASRGIANALPFQVLPEVALTGQRLEATNTQRQATKTEAEQTREVSDRIARNREITDSNLRVNDAEMILKSAQTESAKAAAYQNYIQAWEAGQRGMAAGRYPGELPPGTQPNVTQMGGQSFIETPRGLIRLPPGQKPGTAATEKPPPMGAMTSEQADQYVSQFPPERKATKRELPGRPGLFTVTTVPGDAGAPLRRARAVEELRKQMPSRLPGGLGGGAIYGGTKFTDALMQQQGNALLQQATGRPIPITSVLDQHGLISEEKLNQVLQDAEDDEATKGMFLGWGE